MLLQQFCDECQEQHEGENVLLVFNEGLKKLLKEPMSSRDLESEAISMAKVIRQEIFDWNSFDFSGSFPPNCQVNSVPTTLKMLMSILNGPNVQHQDVSESLHIVIFQCQV